MYYSILRTSACIFLFLLIVKCILKYKYRKCNTKVCLIGKTALVTGGNKGIGFQTSLGLASRGCKVIIASRTNAEKEIKKIIEMTHNSQIYWKHLDLSSLNSVRKLSDEIHKNENKIDILVNNAGVAIADHKYTEDGLHHGTQVNLFGGVLLTHLLVDLLKASQQARVIFVSSAVMYRHRLTLDNLNFPENSEINVTNGFIAYSNSKVAVAMVGVELAERLKRFNITVNSIHPGLVMTEFFDGIPETTIWSQLTNFIFLKLLYFFMRTPEEGAQRSLRYAMSNSCQNITGHVDSGYNWLLGIPSCIKDKQFRRKIFEKTETLIQLKDNEKIPE